MLAERKKGAWPVPGRRNHRLNATSLSRALLGAALGLAVCGGLGLGLWAATDPGSQGAGAAGPGTRPGERLAMQLALVTPDAAPALPRRAIAPSEQAVTASGGTALAALERFSVRRRMAGLHAAGDHGPIADPAALEAASLADLRPRDRHPPAAKADADGLRLAKAPADYAILARQPATQPGEPTLGGDMGAALFGFDGFREAPLGGQLGDPAEIECLALNIYFESRGEGEAGRLAVGNVTMNRVLDPAFPATVCGVVTQGGLGGKPGCQFSWWCDGRSDEPLDQAAWAESRATALKVYWDRSRDLTKGALWFHADYVSPDWADVFDKGPQIGRHLFYSRPQEVEQPPVPLPAPETLETAAGGLAPQPRPEPGEGAADSSTGASIGSWAF